MSKDQTDTVSFSNGHIKHLNKISIQLGANSLPGIVLNTSHILIQCLQQPYQVSTMPIPILKVRKLDTEQLNNLFNIMQQVVSNLNFFLKKF